ncbi:hypothetical protein HHI36_010528 [Cryptolaemus montrouzieri]|uniref:Uncharacterized protein n=1 Tax=Cryptolaemus montrouzieri TaxID=559131 RepID=A0ABD2MJ69_9CUCU
MIFKHTNEFGQRFTIDKDDKNLVANRDLRVVEVNVITMNLVFHLVLILISTCCCNCIKLLILLTNPGRSHFYVFKPLVIELNRRGHNITMVAHFSSGLSESNSYRELILKDENKEAVHIFDLEKNMPNLNKNRKDLVLRIRERSFIQCNSSLSQDVMRNLIAEKDQYDLILLEYFSNDCFFGFIDKFRIPVVGLSTTSILPWHNDRFGNIENPSYIPNAFSNFNTKMNFWDRMSNLFFVELYKYHYDTYISKVNEYFAEKFFNSKIAFKKDFITNYSSLMLVNTHYSLNIARPLVPSVIEVGGIHIGMPEKLPKVCIYEYLVHNFL